MRSESGGNAALSSTVILAILNVPLKLGTVNVESSVPGPVAVAAGIVWPTLADGKYCGPEIEPVGPMICEHLAGGEGAHLHGPVERHVERAGRAVDDQVVGRCRLPPGTEVLRTCGPGTISGSVF